eukprot:69600-Amphidinium_carterae.1
MPLCHGCALRGSAHGNDDGILGRGTTAADRLQRLTLNGIAASLLRDTHDEILDFPCRLGRE